MLFSTRTALLSGAASGIGRAVALANRREGRGSLSRAPRRRAGDRPYGCAATG